MKETLEILRRAREMLLLVLTGKPTVAVASNPADRMTHFAVLDDLKSEIDKLEQLPSDAHPNHEFKGSADAVLTALDVSDAFKTAITDVVRSVLKKSYDVECERGKDGSIYLNIRRDEFRWGEYTTEYPFELVSNPVLSVDALNGGKEAWRHVIEDKVQEQNRAKQRKIELEDDKARGILTDAAGSKYLPLWVIVETYEGKTVALRGTPLCGYRTEDDANFVIQFLEKMSTIAPDFIKSFDGREIRTVLCKCDPVRHTPRKEELELL